MPNTPKGLTYPSNASPVAVPADIQELATDVDNIIVPISGGTYSGAVAFLQNPSVPTPTSALHAVNKTYADSINADVTALENELGANPSGTFSTVVQRLDTYTDGFGKIGNLLTANQASLETDTTGLVSGTSAPTLARSSTQAKFGTYSLSVTATTTAMLTFAMGPGTANYAPVTAGETYTASVELYAATTSRNAVVSVAWYTSGGSSVSVANGASTALPLNAWSRLSLTADAPATAAYGRIIVTINSAATSDVFYADCFGLWRGTGGVWSLPGTPIVGQSPIASNGAVHLSGTGVPESVITAAPGSTWLQTGDAVTVSGNLLWRKATGTGTTGWTPEGALADTGWRNVSANIRTPWSGTLQIRRIGPVVHVRAYSLKPSESSASFYDVPSGFRVVGGEHQWLAAENAGSPRNIYMWSGGAHSLGTASSYLPSNWYQYLSVEIAYTTADAWPSSLPGSAV